MTIAGFIRDRYMAKERDVALKLFKERVYRTLQDAHDAMDRDMPSGHVEFEMGRAAALVRSGNSFMSRGAMSAEDVDDLEFYERLVKMMNNET